MDWTRDAPILVVCPSRPEVLEKRPTLVTARENVTLLRLGPLAAADTGTLIDALPGGVALPAALRRRIEEVAEGNPLFVEEMLGMLIDDGRLRPEGDEWVAAPGLESLSVPPSVQALIAARIDALAADERGVAERASVIGREFERSAVASLTATDEREPLAARLLSLSRKELIESTEPGLGGDDAFRFRHILIRDAAYERLPKRERAVLHARLADWLEGISGEGRGDLLEIIGYHLAEAVRYRAEIGMDNDAALMARAVATLSDAAERAEKSHRAADAADLCLRLVAILEAAGRDHDAVVAVDAARRRAAEAAHLAGRADLAISVIGDVISRIDPVGDPTAAGSGYERLGTYLIGADRSDDARDAYRQSLDLLVRSSPERARTLASLGRLEMLLDHDGEAEAVLREALEIPGASASVLASAMTTLGTIVNKSGAWEEGVEWIRRGLEAARSADDGFELIRAYNNLAGALERAGEIAASVATFEEGYAEIVKRQMARSAPVLLANWSFNLLLMGRVREAETLARQALEYGPAPGFVSNVWDRLGWALLMAGRIGDAQEAYEQAGVWAARNPGPVLQLSRFERHMGFGRVLAAADAFDAADAQFREALPNDLTSFPLAALPDLVAEATGNRATQATRLRAAGDLAGATDAAASAERWTQEFARLWPTGIEPSPRLHPALAVIDAEVGRAAGRSDPEAWARVIELAQPVEMRLAEVYARFRYAEALAMAGRPPDEVSEAVRAALELSRELGTGLYTVQIEALSLLRRSARTMPRDTVVRPRRSANARGHGRASSPGTRIDTSGIDGRNSEATGSLASMAGQFTVCSTPAGPINVTAGSGTMGATVSRQSKWSAVASIFFCRSISHEWVMTRANIVSTATSRPWGSARRPGRGYAAIRPIGSNDLPGGVSPTSRVRASERKAMSPDDRSSDSSTER